MADFNLVQGETTDISENGQNISVEVNQTVLNRIEEAFISASSGKTLVAGAITGKGVPTQPTDTFQTMANNISSISNSGEGFIPHPDWWDIDTIIANDNSGYRKKIIYLMSDSTNITDINFLGSQQKPIRLITSDNVTYNDPNPTSTVLSWRVQHSWNLSLDKECSDGYKTRWIMLYYSNDVLDSKAIPCNAPANTLYYISDTIKFSNYNSVFPNTLYSAKFLNNSNIADTYTNTSSMVSQRVILKELPNIDFANVTNCDSMFNNCYLIKNIGNNILNTINVTTAQRMFNYCHSLENITLNTTNMTNLSMMFYGCSNLKHIGELNLINATNLGSMFFDCLNVHTLNIVNLNTNIDLSACLLLEPESIINMLNSVVDKTGLTSQTITLGTSLKTRLLNASGGETSILNAESKNWVIN